jgi:hypothetical protein
MRVSLSALQSVLQNNVAEIRFTRRIPKPGKPPYRRMLCTNSGVLLNSTQGRSALNYVPPKTAPDYNPSTKNLVITWDIFMQGYRTVNCDYCDLITLLPANELFWDYFTEKVVKMTPSQKTAFMSV